MTVNTTANRVSYAGNGSTTAFAFPNYFQMAANLVVLLVDSSGNQTVQTLTSQYTISGTQDANGFYPNGGTVNFITAPAVGFSVVIYRDPARTQLTQHVDGDSMPAASIDGPLDKLTMIAQRHDDLITRSLRQPDGDTTNFTTVPPAVTRANGGLGSYAGYDSTGQPTVFVPGPAQSAVSVAMSPVVTALTLAAARSAMGLAIGTNVEAQSALLDDIAGITFSQGDVIYYNGSHLVRLAAGTSGQALLTQGAGANPVWVGPVNGLSNKFHNGGCRVAQRTIAPNLSTSFQYGKVDRFMVAATAGTVGAGTITQDTASPAGRTGYSLKAAGVTTTVAGTISTKQRIESVDAVELKNQNASFGVRVYHDVGSNINYQITIRKPTVADNYGSTTQIAQSGLISVPTATDTLITFTNQALGDCSLGLEVQVDAISGVVTTKNFHFTEWQLVEGAVLPAFERRPYAQELRDCQRYYEVGQIVTIETLNSGVNLTFTHPSCFKVTKRAAPTFTNSASGLTNASSMSAAAVDTEWFKWSIASTTSGGSTCNGTLNWTASADL